LCWIIPVDALKIPGLGYRVTNNVFAPRGHTPGITYSRNIIFTLPNAEPQRDSLIAQLEDLGARYNSHCVTCIGSG
jgi:hypothetical protein